MQVYDAIRKRRSIRMFKPDAIDDIVIDRIMEAACWAPSALNAQNWKFYVLTGEKRDQFARLLIPVFDQMKDTIHQRYGPEGVEIRRKLYTNAGNAPVIIVCYVEEGTWNWDKTGPGMACQNILLTATSEGLGSLYMGAPRYVKDSVNDFLGEKSAELMGAILIGYADQDAGPPPRIQGKVVRIK